MSQHINTDILIGKTTEHLAQTGTLAGVLHAEVAEAYEDLENRASNAGFGLRIISGFRSFERQLKIWNAKASGQRPVLDDNEQLIDMEHLADLKKIERIMRFSAMPGASRHHWGTDFDVYDAAAMDDNYSVQLTLSETVANGPFSELHQWLNIELPKTEFYRPYAQDLGGVSPEPWHLSYRPLAQLYATRFNQNLLLDAWQGVDLALEETIKTNIDALYNRFVLVD